MTYFNYLNIQVIKLQMKYKELMENEEERETKFAKKVSIIETSVFIIRK